MADECLKQAKACSKCLQILPLSDFHVRRASRDGLAYKCRACVNAATEAWKARNPGAFKSWYVANQGRRSEYWIGWYQANREHRAASYAAWAKRNKHVVNALIMKRYAAKKNATPAWADYDKIREFYREAARLTEATGVRHEVDHIYPLQGKNVSGLHCEANLQIITKLENLRKRNKPPELLGYA